MEYCEAEVDFIVGDMKVGIEAKASCSIDNRLLRGLRELQREYPRVRRRIVVSLEERRRITEDGIEVLPASEFARLLWDGEILS